MQRETRGIKLGMVEKTCKRGVRIMGRRWGQMRHHDDRGRTYSRYKRAKDHSRSITEPVVCPGGYPVKVAFSSPETSRYFVRMWVDDRAIGIWAKMYRGWVQGNELIHSGSRREKVDTRQSR
jgi:hypothetical protein